MRYILSLAMALLLTGCIGGNQAPALPPELQGGIDPITGLPVVPGDPLAAFPPIDPLDPSDGVEEVPSENLETTEEPDEPVVASNPDIDCDAVVSDLEISFSDMNFCDADADCAVASGSCPFGCYLFHHNSIDFADYQETLDTYQASCNPCEYECTTEPKANERRCVEGRCVDTRFNT